LAFWSQYSASHDMVSSQRGRGARIHSPQMVRGWIMPDQWARRTDAALRGRGRGAMGKGWERGARGPGEESMAWRALERVVRTLLLMLLMLALAHALLRSMPGDPLARMLEDNPDLK